MTDLRLFYSGVLSKWEFFIEIRAACFAPYFLQNLGVLEWGWLQVGSFTLIWRYSTLHPISKIGKLVMLMQIFHISTFKRTHNPRIKFLIPSEKVKAWFSFCLKYFPMVSWLVSRNKWVLLLRRRNYISRCAVVAAPIFPLFRIHRPLYIAMPSYSKNAIQ